MSYNPIPILYTLPLRSGGHHVFNRQLHITKMKREENTKQIQLYTFRN